MAALKAGAADYLKKSGLTAELLGSAIRHAMEIRRVARERSEAQADLLREKEFVTAVLENSYDGIAVASRDGRIKLLNPSMLRIFGYDIAELPSVSAWARLAFPDSVAELEALRSWAKVQASSAPPERTFPFRHKSGELRWCRLQLSPMPGGDIVVNGQDITQQKFAEQRIEHLAMHDALTDLPTRRLFRDRLEHALAMAKRNNGAVALLYADLDKFKPINDTQGHEIGDMVLVETSRRLVQRLRASDTVARVGGDEFAIILPKPISREDAALVARKIIHAVTQPIATPKGPQTVGVSVGASFFPEHGSTMDELLNAADRAMYVAKRRGGDAYHLAP